MKQQQCHDHCDRLKCGMRKIQTLILLIVIGAVFLFGQIYFVKHASKSGKVNTESDDVRDPFPHEIVLPDTSYLNNKDFVRLCSHHDLPVFLVDPFILGTVMGNQSRSLSSPCHFLCGTRTVTTFAVVSSAWNTHEAIMDSFRENNFSIVSFHDRDPRLQSSDTITEVLVPTHYIFHRDGHSCHLVVFYERNAGFWWHGPLSWQLKVKGNTEKFKIHLSHFQFQKQAGAFDKVEVVKVEMDTVPINVPRYPSVFLQQIPQSHFIECHHKRARLFYDQHGRDTNLEALLFRKKARQLLAKAKLTLDEIGIQFWIISGTCLGWFRQCDIIPYSKDVDIGIWIKDYNEELIPAMQANGLLLKRFFGKPEDSFLLAFHTGDVKLDIFFFYEDEDCMWNGGTQAHTGKKFKFIYPKFSLCWTEFLDLKLYIPCQTESYIKAEYGEDWFQPVLEWDWKSSPSNVRPNGQWPKSEWDKVIQTY